MSRQKLFLDKRIKIRRFFDLLLALVRRDVTARYRRSLLGPAWAILQPLVLMVLFTMLRSFLSISSEGVSYALFSYAALVPWTFFSNAVSMCGSSVRNNAAIVKKISIPREIFPLAAVITALFDLAMSGLVLAGMMLWFRVTISWYLLWLPVLILLVAGLAFSVGMLIASVGTYKQDFIFAIPFMMQFWLYATPVIYPLSNVPDRWKSLYMLNPMVGIVEGFRNVLIEANPPLLGALGSSTLVILILFAVSWPLFRRFSQYFADVL